MNKEEIKILSYLSDNLGSGGNILEMKEGINRKYGPAYYPNIYNSTRKLEKMGIIDIESEGKNKLITLDIQNPFSTYYLSEIENHKTSQMIMPKEILGSILSLPEKFNIFSICALETERYMKLNRIELLFLTRKNNENDKLIQSLLQMESNYNMKIDPIILTIGEFAKIMESDELSPIKDLILNKYILYNSDGFWDLIKNHRITAKYKRFNRFPQDIARDELAYNYNRFGYQLNEQIKPSDKISLETTIFSMSIKDEARIKYGAIILLYKNIDKINLAYLFYLYKRYEELGKLKGILLSLAAFDNLKTNPEIISYIDLIAEKSPPKDNKMIKKYLELYE